MPAAVGADPSQPMAEGDGRRGLPGLGELFADTWMVTRLNLSTVTAIVLIIFIPVDFLVAISPLPEGSTRHVGEYMLEFWVGTIGYLALAYVGRGAEKPVRLADAFGRAGARYWPGLLGTLLFTAGLFLGFVLLVVPGIVFMIYGVFYLQAVVLADCSGMQAIEESHRLVKGRWWRMFRLVGVTIVLFVAMAMITAPVFILWPENRWAEFLAGIPLRLGTACLIICWTRLYLLCGGKVASEAQELAGGTAHP